MFKYQEALDQLKHAANEYFVIKENYFAAEDMVENSNILQELVDKATPKKVTKVTYINSDNLSFDCPVCKTRVLTCFKYCRKCGQRLEFGGESDE